jgi:hypothetical protein
MIIAEGFRADGDLAVVLGEVLHAVGGSVFKNVFAQGHDIAALVRIIVQERSRHGPILLAHAQHAAGAQNGEHDVV